MKIRSALLAILIFRISAAFGCSVPGDYKEAIRASISAANPDQDETVFTFYAPAKGIVGSDSTERCVVRCDYSPGSKKSGRVLMIVQSA